MRLCPIFSTSTLLAALCLAAQALDVGARALADVGSERRPLAIFTVGPSAEYGLNGEWRFGAELGLSQYVGGWGYGAAVGGLTSGRAYGEAQSALVLGSQHNLVLGFNPGVVVDVTAAKPRWGAQATLWANYAYSRRRTWPLASPLFPFVRVQAVDSFGVTFTVGVSLKMPLPAS